MLRAPKGFIDETDPKVCQVGHPAPGWMVNYADLMTELVCFFVILYALSASMNKDVQKATKEVEEKIKNEEIAGSVKVDKDGMHITIQERGEAAFFRSGWADTTQEMEGTVAKLAPTLKDLSANHDILVEGHTDNQGISNDYFDSNWELSTARATSVARMLVDKFGIPPDHVGAVGYGQYRPIAPNDTPENRARNRRVVFFVKNNPNPMAPKKDKKTDGPAPSEAQAPPAPAAAPVDAASEATP